jgi:hypothetical protein
MKTKSINTIVRESLLDNNLPLHFYTRFLHHALRIVDELSMDFDLGNVKIIELDITSYNRAILPSDFVDYVDVSVKSGERLLPLERERNLNKKYNYDEAGNKIPYISEERYNDLDLNLLIGGKTVNQHGELSGRMYGRERRATLTFDIDKINSELVFSNTTELSKITLTYISTAVSKSSANAITPYAVDVVVKYIQMMSAKAQGAKIGLYQMFKQDYENAHRVFRARMNSMDYADIIGALRRGIHGSLKN